MKKILNSFFATIIVIFALLGSMSLGIFFSNEPIQDEIFRSVSAPTIRADEVIPTTQYENQKILPTNEPPSSEFENSLGTTSDESNGGEVIEEVPSDDQTNSLDQKICNGTAICSDGTCSYSKSRRGTCSHHGGVATWL